MKKTIGVKLGQAVILVVIAIVALTATCAFSATDRFPLQTIKLPPGFSINLFAEVPNARSMTLAPGGTLFVGTRKAGKVHAIPNSSKENQTRKPTVIAERLNMPNGVAFKDGALYVAEVNRVLRYDGIESRLNDVPKPVVVNNGFPTDQHHGWKFLAFGPDGQLYVPVGAPCNICEPDPERYAVLKRMKANGSNVEVFARGIRNTVGFDWHPQTKELWFTENGRDRQGDDVPPDELNHAPKPGLPAILTVMAVILRMRSMERSVPAGSLQRRQEN